MQQTDIKIKVIGLGGAGVGTINFLAEDKCQEVEYIAIDSNLRKIIKNDNIKDVIIGQKTCKGLGTGGNFELGKKAIEEDKEIIEELLQNTDLLFITVGLGGGLGSGSLSTIVEVANKLKILTVGVLTSPFSFEGKSRNENTIKAINSVKNMIDSFILISNDKLLELPNNNISFKNAFVESDNVLKNAVKGIINLILENGLVNLDFEDVRTILKDSGISTIGIGEGAGENKVEMAIKNALNLTLSSLNLKNPKKMLINITSSNSINLSELNALHRIFPELGYDPETIIFGITENEGLEDSVEVMVIATSFENSNINL